MVLWQTIVKSAAALSSLPRQEALADKPNIVIIMSDDQDRRLSSTDHMPNLQSLIADNGVEFTNHYTNTALCCPSRSTFLRGQATHNTNMTNVTPPGGHYNKWVLSEQDQNYLPNWLKKAGYKAEYLGKILNGYGIINYDQKPKGWDHVDALVEPYIDYYNIPVFSANGETPIYYKGWHQTDVLRVKSLERLDTLASNDDPFFMMISPFAPHVGHGVSRPVPAARHKDMFKDLKAPRTPNFNPDDAVQSQKGNWLNGVPKMDQEAIDFADFAYRSRIQSLQAIDDIIEDVVNKLEEKGKLENTYVIYTTDNGYHVGQHRLPAGKSMYFSEDTNLPLFVRGPGVPKGKTSKVPGLHLDFAPTFLDIAGLDQSEWPEFFDGRSLLNQWKNPETAGNGEGEGEGNGKESVGIEYWGTAGIEAPSGGKIGSPILVNSYKTVRILGENQGWLYTKWCNGDAELYNTTADNYELHNILSQSNDQEAIAPIHKHLHNRLDALTMVTKSCGTQGCRDPWSLISGLPDGDKLRTLTEAMYPKYDEFFEQFEKVQFGKCMAFQDDDNEAPYYPPLPPATGGLGREYRHSTDHIPPGGGISTIEEKGMNGGEEQRHAKDIGKEARPLTREEIEARG